VSFYGWDPAAGPSKAEVRQEQAREEASEMEFSGADIWEVIAWDKDMSAKLEAALESGDVGEFEYVRNEAIDFLREKHVRGVR